MTAVIAAGSEMHKKTIYELVKEDDVTYKYGVVKSLSESDKTITLADNTSLSFDVAVVATGVKIPFYYPDPETEQTVAKRSDSVNQMFENVKNAKSIVISGGGPVGIETAADIKLRFKDKK
jgi:apoptosis-inducing factor 2